MKNSGLALLVASTTLLACAKPVDRVAEADNIREAMFRFMIAEQQGLQGQEDHYYFLSVLDDGSCRYRDPPDEFMSRFNGGVPAVKKVSQCTYEAPPGVMDRVSRTRGHILHLDPIRWLSDREVEIRWTDYTNGWSNSGGRCRLKWSVGNWILTSKTLESPLTLGDAALE